MPIDEVSGRTTQRTPDVILVQATFPDLTAAGLVEPFKCIAHDHIIKDKIGTDIVVVSTGLLPLFDDVLCVHFHYSSFPLLLISNRVTKKRHIHTFCSTTQGVPPFPLLHPFAPVICSVELFPDAALSRKRSP